MKKGIHPENYRPVVFKDMSNGDMFLSRSTCATKDTIEFEGETYPLVKLEISSTSHILKEKNVHKYYNIDEIKSLSQTHAHIMQCRYCKFYTLLLRYNKT